MRQYRVVWKEVKSMVVLAEDMDEAEQIAMDEHYEHATLEEQYTTDIIIDANPRDDEQVWGAE